METYQVNKGKDILLKNTDLETALQLIREVENTIILVFVDGEQQAIYSPHIMFVSKSVDKRLAIEDKLNLEQSYFPLESTQDFIGKLKIVIPKRYPDESQISMTSNYKNEDTVEYKPTIIKQKNPLTNFTSEQSLGLTEFKPFNVLNAMSKMDNSMITGTICSKCLEPQFNTPSGISCPNGHGSVESHIEEWNN